MPHIRKSVRMRRFMFNSTGSYNSTGFRVVVILLLLLAFLLIIFIPIRNYLKEVVGSVAMADCSDKVTALINDTVRKELSDSTQGYDYFVTLQKDSSGKITAITTNMARINSLTSDVVHDVIASVDSGELDLSIPVGNLLGSNLLLGRGPKIPIKIIMLTCTSAEYHNELSSVSINQSRHQILLDIKVNIDVLLPWEIRSTEVVSEVLIAETVIVGQVPDSYFQLDK